MFSFLRKSSKREEPRMSPKMQQFANEVNGEINAGFAQMRRGFQETGTSAEDEQPAPRRAVG